MTTIGKVRAAVVAALLLVAGGSASAVSVMPLFRTGDAAPGLTPGTTDGVFEAFWGGTDINASGVVSFYAWLEDGRTGIWRSTSAVVRTGDNVGGWECDWVNNSPTINDAGFVAYKAGWEGEGYSEEINANLATVDYVGRDLGDGRYITWLHAPRINNDGHVVYYADISSGEVAFNGSGGTNPANGGGYWEAVMQDEDVVVQSGDTNPDTDPALPTPYESFWRPVISNTGRIAFSAAGGLDGEVDVATQGPKAADDGWWEAICTPQEVIAVTGGPTPLGGQWDYLYGPTINSQGLIAWIGEALLEGVEGEEWIAGVFTEDGCVVKTGDPVPGHPDWEYEYFGFAPAVNASGEWIVWASVYDNDEGEYYYGIFGNAGPIALEGWPVEGGGHYQSFQRPCLNDAGQFSFIAYVSDSPTGGDMVPLQTELYGVFAGSVRPQGESIPEPATMVLLGAGLLALVRRRRR